jgi:superfamily II DNA or RNA helicase
LIVVPVRDLMYQWHEKILQSTGIDAGLIGDGVHRVSPISVTTYDSAAIHMPRIGDKFSMVIFDEVHHLAGPWRSDAARMSAATGRLGLTATLPREPARLASLYDLVGPVLYQQNIADAAGDTLAQYSVRRIAVRMNEQERTAYSQYSRTIQQFVSDRRQLDPQFIWEDVYKLVADTEGDPECAASAMLAVAAFRSKRKIEEQAAAKMRILEDLFRLHSGSPVIVFTGSNVMARQISTRFLVPCLLSNCAKKERQDLLRGFAEGRYPALVANRVLDEGVDLPEVKTAIVMGGLSSQRQAIQRLGRVLRKGANNETAVLYEVVTEDSGEVQRSRDRRRNEAYRARPKS